jgi:two-component system, chemotaxis family, response regulator WspR
MAVVVSSLPGKASNNEVVVLLVSGRPERGSSLGPTLDEGSGGRLRLVVVADLQDAGARAIAVGASVILLELPEEKEQRRRMVRHLSGERAFATAPLMVIDTRPGVDELVRRQLFAAGAVDYLPGWPDGVELTARLLAHGRGPLAERARDAVRADLERARADLVAARSDLQRANQSDAVTGLPGPERLAEFLDNEWRRARRNGSALSLVLIDVETERAGEVEGALQAVAPALRGTLRRGGDLLACVRSGRFAAVLPEVAGEGAAVVAKSLLRSARSARPAATFKVGVATSRPKDPASVSPAALLAEAEASLARRLD